MTTLTASLHHPLAGACHSWRCTAVAPVPAKAAAMPPIVAESHRRVQQRRPILYDRRQSTRNDASPAVPRRGCCSIKSP